MVRTFHVGVWLVGSIGDGRGMPVPSQLLLLVASRERLKKIHEYTTTLTTHQNTSHAPTFRFGMAMALANMPHACSNTFAVAGPSRKWWWKSSGSVMVSFVPSGTGEEVHLMDAMVHVWFMWWCNLMYNSTLMLGKCRYVGIGIRVGAFNSPHAAIKLALSEKLCMTSVLDTGAPKKSNHKCLVLLKLLCNYSSLTCCRVHMLGMVHQLKLKIKNWRILFFLDLSICSQLLLFCATMKLPNSSYNPITSYLKTWQRTWLAFQD